MKKLLVILCLCSLLLAFAGCSGTAPAATETSTATQETATESIETTAESTTETTLETPEKMYSSEEPAAEVTRTIAVPMSNQPFAVGNYPYLDHGKTSNTLTVALPATWEEQEDTFVDSVSGDSIFFDCVYFSSNFSLLQAIEGINAYIVTKDSPVPVYTPVVAEDAFYLMSDGNDKYLCGFRVGEDYIVALKFCGTAHDVSFLREITKTVTVKPRYPAETQTIQIKEELRPIRMQTDQCITAEFGWSLETKELNPPLQISLSLPASWKELPLPESYQGHTALYAELSPHGGACRDACLCRAFYTSDLYSTKAVIESEFVTEKKDPYQSEKGLTYWFIATEYPALHAISYMCCVQLSDQYIFEFYLCADSDDPDLIHRIADTIEIAGASKNN